MAPPTKPSCKPIFKTSSPFTETEWPEIPENDAEIVLDLVCNLISPLGDHRRTHIQPSKGRKRKRSNKTRPVDEGPTEVSLPPPEIGNHILIGLNSVTRHLEALAAKNAPSSMPTAAVQNDKNGGKHEGEQSPALEDVPRPLSMVLLTHPKPSSSLAHAHLPTLVNLTTVHSSSSASLSSATRLVTLPTSWESRLASNLHIPRVGALAICEGAPGAKALESFVSENVPLTKCRWIDEAMRAEWKGVSVKTEIPGRKN